MGRPEKKPATPLASRLRKIRRVLGDPDREAFAKKIGISRNSLAAYERGENEPVASVLASYSIKCGISSQWLLTGLGEMFSQQEYEPIKHGLTLDTEVLYNAIHTVEKGLNDRLKPISITSKAELIVAAYKILYVDKTNSESIVDLIHAL